MRFIESNRRSEFVDRQDRLSSSQIATTLHILLIVSSCYCAHGDVKHSSNKTDVTTLKRTARSFSSSEDLQESIPYQPVSTFLETPITHAPENVKLDVNIQVTPNSSVDFKQFQSDGKNFKVIKKKIKRSKQSASHGEANRFVCIQMAMGVKPARFSKKCYSLEQLLAIDAKKLSASSKHFYTDKSLARPTVAVERQPGPIYAPIIDPNAGRAAPSKALALPLTEFQRRSDVSVERENGNELGSENLDPLKVDESKTPTMQDTPSLNLYEYKTDLLETNETIRDHAGGMPLDKADKLDNNNGIRGLWTVNRRKKHRPEGNNVQTPAETEDQNVLLPSKKIPKLWMPKVNRPAMYSLNGFVPKPSLTRSYNNADNLRRRHISHNLGFANQMRKSNRSKKKSSQNKQANRAKLHWEEKTDDENDFESEGNSLDEMQLSESISQRSLRTTQQILANKKNESKPTKLTDKSKSRSVSRQPWPLLNSIPKTSFECGDRRANGVFADTETGCQVWHICQNGAKHSFLCPNGTIFSSKNGVCDWWYNTRCG